MQSRRRWDLSGAANAALDGLGAGVEQPGKPPRVRLEYRRSDDLGATRRTAGGPEEAATDVPDHDNGIAGRDGGRAARPEPGNRNTRRPVGEFGGDLLGDQFVAGGQKPMLGLAGKCAVEDGDVHDASFVSARADLGGAP